MGRYVFKLPDVGEGTAEAEIVAWHVAVGDRVKEDQQLVDVMTDKATVEMTSPVDGTVVSLKGQPGEMAPVGAVLVEFDTDEDKSSAVKPMTVAATPKSADAPPHPPREQDNKKLASPAVRLRAADLGIALDGVRGTGPGGRVTHGDLDDHLAGGAPVPRAPQVPRDGIEEVKLIGLRRRIAEKMQDAKRRIPHFAYVEEIDMTELETCARISTPRGNQGSPSSTSFHF